MNPDMQLALLTARMAQYKAARLAEDEARDVLSNHLAGQVNLLFPKAPPEFIAANGDFANELARGAGELVDAISAASINWTGPVEDTGVEKMFTGELVKLLAQDALVTGKLALFPRIDERGRFKVEALAGYLQPIMSETDATEVEALLQVLPVWREGKQLFVVRRYSAGLLEVFPPVSDWANFSDGTPEDFPQPHAADQLPVAFSIVRRDFRREPAGLVVDCLSAFRRFAKSAINRNAVQEIAGYPESVVKSDKYLGLLLDAADKNRPEHPAVTALKKKGPRLLKLLGTNDSYEVQEGVDLGPHMTAEEADKQALLDMLRSPDLNGGNQTEVALAERQGKSRQLIMDMCSAIAGVVTAACALASGLSNSGIPEGIQASLTPRWPAESMARAATAGELFAKSGVPRSVLYLELQNAGWKSITDAMIEAEQQAEAADRVPVVTG